MSEIGGIQLAKKREALSREMKQEIVELAIETYQKEVEKSRKAARDKVLHNTKLLLINFRGLVAHSESAIYEASQCDDDVYDILNLMTGKSSDNEMYVESIKRSAVKTRLIIEHIKNAVDDYERYCIRTGKEEELRRCRTICHLYIDEAPMTVQEIADLEVVDVSTVYKDIKEAVKRLTPRIFGIEGLF